MDYNHREQPVIGSFYRYSRFFPASSPDGDDLALRKWLSRFRQKDGWNWTKKALSWWRKHTVEWLRSPYGLPEQYAFATRLIATWADVDLHIDSSPIRLMSAIICRQYSHIGGGDDIIPDPILDDEALVNAYLRDAIIAWERIYDASEAIAPVAPTGRLDGGKKRRPAYARDHLWLKWQEAEGLTPAKIRDRWNEMEDFSRETICPGCPDMVMTELVVTSLKRAKKDRKNGK